jgi:uncharacterized protein (DUF362 family)
VLKEILAIGAQPIVGDSPGLGSLSRVAEKAGIACICRELKVPLGAFNQEVQVRTAPEGKILKSFPLVKEMTEVDAVINLPRVKTHGLTRLTGAVKNLFGCVAGLHKGELHFRLQRADVFQEMLIDLALTVKPVLTIVDGVMAMTTFYGPNFSGREPVLCGCSNRQTGGSKALRSTITSLSS